MASYRYLLGNVVTGDLLAEMPFETATYGHILNAPGAFSGTLGLEQPADVHAILEPLLGPRDSQLGKLSLYVERDQVIVWGGMLWTSEADLDAGTLKVNGEGWHSYFRRRALRVKKTYSQDDQTLIAKDLIDWAQGVTGGDIGVDTTGVTASGVNRDRVYEAYERKNIGEAIEQLAEVDDGFTFRYDSRWNGADIETRFLTQYPKSGRNTDMVFFLGGAVTDANIKVDATALASVVDAIGSGDGDQGLIVTQSDPSAIGVTPLLDDVISYTDINRSTALLLHALERLRYGKRPIVLPAITIDPSIDPVIGSYIAGDVVTVRGGYGLAEVDQRVRITEYSVEVDENGGESAKVTFAGLEAF